MKKNKFNEPKPNILKRISKWWLLFIILGWFLYVSGKQTYINYGLKNYGKRTKAVVYDRNKVGGKGTVDTKFIFEWEGRNYTGSSTSDVKYQETDDFFLTEDDLVTGDTIIIVFLESNPEINRSNSLVKKDCD